MATFLDRCEIETEKPVVLRNSFPFKNTAMAENVRTEQYFASNIRELLSHRCEFRVTVGKYCHGRNRRDFNLTIEGNQRIPKPKNMVGFGTGGKVARQENFTPETPVTNNERKMKKTHFLTVPEQRRFARPAELQK